MYKTLLSDYDTRQKELLLENAELNKVLQQMKKDMVSILSTRKSTLKRDEQQDDCMQVEQVIFSCLCKMSKTMEYNLVGNHPSLFDFVFFFD